MPRIEVNGRIVEVDDSFSSLTPEQKNAVVDEIAASMGPAGAPDAPQDGSRGFGAFLNQGIFSVLDLPGDILYGGMGALGLPAPSKEEYSIAGPVGRWVNDVGIATADVNAIPETASEKIGQGLGAAAGALPVGGAVTSALSRGGQMARGVGQAIASPFVQTPGRAIASELAAGGGAGLGAHVGEQLAPDSEWGPVVGALVGGGLAGAGPNAVIRGAQALPGTRYATDFIAGQIAPFTNAGAMNRARMRMRSLVEDPEAARAALEAGSMSGLSPAVTTGDRRLMALENEVRNRRPDIDRTMREAEAVSAGQLRATLTDPSYMGNIENARTFAGQRVEDITGRIEARIAGAEARANERIEALDPSRRPSEAAQIVRSELEEARREMRKEESRLWKLVPKTSTVSTSSARKAFDKIVEDTSSATRTDVPAIARELLTRGNNRSFRDAESVQEMHGLYSKLREIARESAASNKANRARISNEIADAIMEDLQRGEGGAELNAAVAYSRQFNQRFRRGEVGRILGSERDGGSTVPDIRTLDVSVGRPGTQGAVGYDAITRALAGRPGESMGAIEDYVSGRLADTAIRGGEFRPDRARTFMWANEDLLNRVPAVRDRAAAALAENEAAARTAERMGARQQAVEESASALFAGSTRGNEIGDILKTSQPSMAARQVVRQAQKDKTGQATLGIKGAFLDDLVGRAKRKGLDQGGQPLLSGEAIIGQLSDAKYGGVASEILSDVEMGRLRQVADELAKLETSQSGLPSVGPIMGDQPNSMVAYLARVMAARSGAAMGAGTSGASLQTAAMASNRMQKILQRLTNDEAEKLIIQAITGDKELFDALLQPTSGISRTKRNRVLEAIVGIGSQQSAETEED